MPKMKTHKGAAKRFTKTASGKLKRSKAFSNHMFAAKTKKQKRNLRKSGLVTKGDARRIRDLIVYVK